MYKLIKTIAFFLLFSIMIVSCESYECEEEIISDEDAISSSLTDKIIATATSVNDMNFVRNNFTSDDCVVQMGFYFMDPEQNNIMGASFSGVTATNFNEIVAQQKQLIEQFFDLSFTEEDFFLDHIITGLINPSGSFMTNTKNGFLDVFDNCTIDNPELAWSPLEIYEINFNCNANASYVIDGGNWYDYIIEDLPLNSGLTSVEQELNNYNTNNNTSYILDDVRLSVLTIDTPLGDSGFNGRENITGYLDDCSFIRNIEESNDCLNFVYPLQVHRFNLELEEVITYDILNDEGLIDVFSEDEGDLVFEYPINLLGQDGTILIIETNEELENALDNSLDYIN